MVSVVFTNLILLSIVLSVYCVLVGRLRQDDEPDSNAVVGSKFIYPDTDDRVICKTDHGYPGRCVDIRRCNAARQAVQSRNHPAICGWIHNHVPRVCCHPDQVLRYKMVFRPYRRRNRTKVE